MVAMEFAGRRRSRSGSYNPLAEKSVHDTGLDTWICVNEDGVQFYASMSLTHPASRHCKFGTEINGVKEGDWLKDNDSGFYLPYLDKDGSRYFKNARALLMEKAAEDGGLTRQISRTSQSSKGSTISGKQSNVSSKGSGDGIERRQSFRWVDTEGISRRIEGDSDALDGVTLRPEVWICVSPEDVPYRTTAMLSAVSGQVCRAGQKVTAVKEDDWLKVIEVKEVFDAMAAAEMIGRRSLKSVSKVSIINTGLFLPFQKDGQRLFKNEKVLLLEAASANGERQNGSANDKGSCSTM
jgi:hypothetical protein